MFFFKQTKKLNFVARIGAEQAQDREGGGVGQHQGDH